MGESIREKQNRLTENEICNSFLHLLQEKPFHKITVADVCRRANINRGTFYLHYRDINDLIEYINSWYVEQLTPLFTDESNSADQFNVHIKEVMEILLSWPEYSTVILGQEKGQKVIDDVIELSSQKVLDTAKRMDPNADLEALMYRFSGLLHGCWAILRRWCRGGLQESPEQIIEYFDLFNFVI